MAHGSPDHTLSIDDSYAHYIWTVYSSMIPSLPSGVTQTIADIDFTGVLCGFIGFTDYHTVKFSVNVDGTKIDEVWAQLLSGFGINRSLVGWTAYDLLRYDAITPAYVFSWGTNYRCYVHKNLEIKVSHSSGVNQMALLYQLTYLKFK